MPSPTQKVGFIYFYVNRENILETNLKNGIGAAVIRMMNDFLGENTFRKGITNYLQQKYLKNSNLLMK
jgi:hypothetical protein